MKRNLFCPLVLLIIAFSAGAKQNNTCAEAQQHRYRNPAAKTAVSPLLELYDIKYVKLDLNMSHLATTVSGSTITTAIVVGTAGMSRYVFELNNKLTIDSVKLNGIKGTSVSISTDLYAIAGVPSVVTGSTFTAQVFYHGTPRSGTGFFTDGVNHDVLSTGTNITYTLSDPYLAKDWWACKQSLTDKIDSADLWFTVPNAAMAGSNGRLQAITPVGTTSSRYEWKTKYPIEYYLISASVAPYVDHSQILHFSGSADSMPVQHFVYDTATFYPLYKSAIDSTPYMVDYLSTLYGRYPFWQEKYGHCIAPLGGGMEHQTMTTLGVFTTPLIAHELGHQWWGDCVTYASWRDIWMSEGWASYTEQLYIEHFRSAAEAQAYRTVVFNRVMSRPGGTVDVDDTTNVFRIFDARLTYDKGAAVAHMLRYLAPDDATFFNGLKAYQRQYAFKTATTADFKAIMEAAYGRSLDTFFNQWVYSEGYPIYTAFWNQLGSDVYVRLEQATSVPASVAAFALPVKLRLTSSSGDTVVKAYFDSALQLYTFTWGRTMDGMVVDPDNDIVDLTRMVIHDETLNVVSTTPDALRIYPNPADDSWHVSGIAPGASLRLTDAGGRVIRSFSNASEQLTIDSGTLPPGIYTLTLRNAGGIVITRVLQKR